MNVRNGIAPAFNEYELLRRYWNQMFSGDEARAQRHVGKLHKIIEAYNEPQRKYHTVSHLIDIFSKLDAMNISFEDAARAIAFVFYHDVVYQTDSMANFGLNEELSAQRAQAELVEMGFGRVMSSSTADLIRASKTHVIAPNDKDGAVLMDADMSILAAPPPLYRVYAGHVREEFGIFSDADFFKGRLNLFLIPTLEGSLYDEGKRIFKTESFRHLEGQARDNLRWEIVLMNRGLRRIEAAERQRADLSLS